MGGWHGGTIAQRHLSVGAKVATWICDLRNGVQRSVCRAAILCPSGPLWVKTGRDALKFRCPLYPRKRTLNGLMHRSKKDRYSITSSARPDKGSGTVIPSALAVLRFTISSTLVARCTGRSAGLSPLRIHSITWSASSKKDSRTDRPRALAVLRLTTSSNMSGD